MRLKPPHALAALGALAVAASLALTGCDASPYAATVNGKVITRVALNTQLKQWAGNKTWVTQFDNANSQQSGGSGTTVQGAGGPGTYSSAFVADILGNMVESTIIRQHLVTRRQLPTPDELTASRAINQYLRADYWNQFPQSLRSSLVEQLADQAPLMPISSDTATLQSAYKQIQPNLFSTLCVTEAAFPTQSAAQTVATEGIVQGARLCFDQATMEDQSPAFRDAVLKLQPGQVSQPIKTTFGYQVVQVQTKASPGFNDDVQRALSVAIASSPPQSITTLIQKASVKVNPAYGTWSNGQIKTPQLTSS